MSDDFEMVRITAAMEGEAVIMANIGRKVSVSEGELVALCNFAKLGLWAVLSGLDGPTGDAAELGMATLIEAISEEFGSRGQDGLSKLAGSVAAILGQSRLKHYVIVSPRSP